MVSVNLSYKSLKSCLDQLAASELITIDVEEKRRTVSTTLEGMKAISLYHSAISSLRGRKLGKAYRKYRETHTVRTT